MRLKSLFVTDYSKVNQWRSCGYEPVDFGLTKKQKLGVGLIISGIVVPVILPVFITAPLGYALLGGMK